PRIKLSIQSNQHHTHHKHGTRSIKNPYKKNTGNTTTPTRGMRAAIKPIKKLASITTQNTLLSSQTTNAYQHKTPTQVTPHQCDDLLFSLCRSQDCLVPTP